MKVCYISYVQYGGGSWVHTKQFIDALKEIHHDVVVHTPLAGVDYNEEKQEGWWATSSLVHHIRELRFLLAMFVRHAAGEIKLLRSIKPDVVILRQGRYLSASLLCRVMKIPVILEVNGPALENKFSPKDQQMRCHWFWPWLERKMLAVPDHIMVVSETLKQYYTAYGIPEEKITSVPNGVDIQTFTPGVNGERIREKFGLTGKTIVGFSGNFAPWRGLHLLAEVMQRIAAMDKYPDVRLLLVGTSGELMTMPELPEAITVITGHIPHDEMPEYLAAIDIFVAPYPPIDPFYFSPLKIFEAMAMGKPVIASAQGQICELIADQESGLLYPPGDEEALLQSIERLLAEHEVRDELGKNARKTMESTFTWSDNAKRMLALCHKVCDIS